MGGEWGQGVAPSPYHTPLDQHLKSTRGLDLTFQRHFWHIIYILYTIYLKL